MATKVEIEFCFYGKGQEEPFFKREYRTGNLVPPVPRKGGEIVVEGGTFVVHKVYQYFEEPHEVAIVVEHSALASAGDPPSDEDEKQTHEPYTGLCRYCGDETCPGEEECNFYDGSHG
jgi:hypothetical protein